MRWYVIQVQNGTEAVFQKLLEKENIPVVIPKEYRLIHVRKRWIEKMYYLFPGYIFICLPFFSAATFQMICKQPGFLHFLPNNENAQPIAEEELANNAFLDFVLKNETITPLTLDLSGSQPVIVDEPLKGFNNQIVKIDRHSRKVHVAVPFHGKEHIVKLSYYER